MSEPSYVITVTPTIMSGTVVRWHANVAEAEAVEPIVSASTERVLIHDESRMTAHLMSEASTAHISLKRDRDADMKHLATHRFRGFLGPLVPVDSATSTEAVSKP